MVNGAGVGVGQGPVDQVAEPGSDLDIVCLEGLKAASFKIRHMASLNTAGRTERAVVKVEGSLGFYIATLKPSATHSNLTPGRYVFAVRVERKPKRGEKANVAVTGPVVAWGDQPP